MSAETIASIWAVLIATAVFLYVVMDGFDLGIGILFPWIDDKDHRDLAVNSVAPVWDGNETWLILGGGGLFAVFPLAYATILPALYMPLILMLLALVFRGVAFEMRFRVESDRGLQAWDWAFSGGSYVATICQGLALGALVQGIKVEGRAYAGGWWDWLTPFSVLTAAALVAGYGLLGACWIYWKTEEHLQDEARRLAIRLGIATLGFIAAVSAIMPFLQPAFRARWFSLPFMAAAAPVPILIAVLAWQFFRNLAWENHQRERDWLPFLCALGFFFLSYTGLAISIWPMIVPPGITIWQAAAPRDSQLFLLVGAVVLIPIILAYTGYVYWLFRGKMKPGHSYH
jgi:cytochrome d ubiquinol oxidase subunit II